MFIYSVSTYLCIGYKGTCMWMPMVNINYTPELLSIQFCETGFLYGPGAYRLSNLLPIKLQYPLVSGPLRIRVRDVYHAIPAFRLLLETRVYAFMLAWQSLYHEPSVMVQIKWQRSFLKASLVAPPEASVGPKWVEVGG